MKKSILLFIAFFFLETGCTTINGVGSKTTLLPGWDRVGHGLKKSVISPHTWAPIAGAAIITVGDWDKDISDWATENTPLFGNVKNAGDWSDYLLDISEGISYGTLLLTPGGDFPNEWFANKGKLAITQYTTARLEGKLTASIKKAAGRERPNQSNNHSFPSGHAADAGLYAGFSRFYINNMIISKAMKYTGGFVVSLADNGCSWARVEAGDHYPTDVLIGHALGNFLAVFVSETFIGNDSLILNSIGNNKDEFGIALNYRF
ncbi:hypothetical protein D1BOALGB6SA_9695 [Olavius sp. associated proteobacterium Delta 1]|nr:hypothetical protein D1BOALGB6SA_9695 [Olavius sp. associated proteobacterium Delta 1]